MDDTPRAGYVQKDLVPVLLQQNDLENKVVVCILEAENEAYLIPF